MTDSVIVGVDGSAASAKALRWAVAHAGRTDAELTVLNAWSLPSAIPGIDFAARGLRSDLEEIAEGMLHDAVAAARSMADAGLGVKGRAVYGAPGRVLIEASRSADLLVIGNVGHSLVSGLLLGSVADVVVRHAHCPVAVVPLDR